MLWSGSGLHSRSVYKFSKHLPSSERAVLEDKREELSPLSPVWCDSIVPSSQQPCVDRECTQLLRTVTSGWQGSVLFILNTVTPTAVTSYCSVQCSDVICTARTLGQAALGH